MQLWRWPCSLLLLVLGWLAMPAPAHAGDAAGAHAGELIARARALGLAHSEQWLRLGHWKRSGWSQVWFASALAGWKSEADGLDLFLAPDGKHAPEAELEATLRAFAQPGPAGDEAGDEHAICRFPARFLWLHRQLGFDLARMQVPRCPKLQEFMETLQPRAAIVVFSAYYITRAASAFGHTFLRIEKNAPLAGSERRQLLDTGIDYSAQVTTSNSFAYALLGMTGGFRGTFRKLPYYYKVREYNDYETRDLWEYRLDLTDEQLAMLVAHLWELGHTYFDYFYLTENCSYHILGAIEVARPDLDLLAQLKTPVIPADTIKVLVDTPGLVADVDYRPSLMTQFRERIAGMSSVQLDLVDTLVASPGADLPERLGPRQRIQVLDAAADLMDILHGEQVLLAPDSWQARAKQRLLERRSRIRQPSHALHIEPPWHLVPHSGHGSRRIGIGAGTMRDRGAYLSMQFRATLHDLADPSRGYPELSQIEFLPMEVRLSLDDQRLRLERASLVRIVHLNSQDRFNRRMSWKVDVGGVRLYDQGCDGCLAASALVGGGLAKALLGERLALFATIDTHLLWAPALDGIEGAPVRLGLGPAAGMRIRWTEHLITLIAGEWLWLPYQRPLAMWSANGTLRWELFRNLALDLDGGVRQGRPQARLSALLYY